MYPELNSREEGIPVSRARRSCRSSCRGVEPCSSRADPAPAPKRPAASPAAAVTSGWAASPR